jgi:hypothetical protein
MNPPSLIRSSRRYGYMVKELCDDPGAITQMMRQEKAPERRYRAMITLSKVVAEMNIGLRKRYLPSPSAARPCGGKSISSARVHRQESPDREVHRGSPAIGRGERGERTPAN